MKTAALLLCCAMFCASCATEPPRLIPQLRVERIAPPAALLDCAEAPPVPDPATATQRSVAEHLADLTGAHEDCRAKLAAVKAFVDGGEPGTLSGR